MFAFYSSLRKTKCTFFLNHKAYKYTEAEINFKNKYV